MAISDRKEREKEKRRNDIIDAAAKLFEKGYENVSMEDIAQKTELARSTLYLYFKNKEDIYIAVAIRGAKILNKKLKKYNQKGNTGIEKIKCLIQAVYKFHLEYPGYYQVNWNSQMPLINSTKVPELTNTRTNSFEIVENAIYEGIKDGSIRLDADKVKSTLIIPLLMQSILNINPAIEIHMKNKNLKHEELFDYAIDMITRSLKKI